MTRVYRRRFDRDPYEGIVVDALVAIGYEVALSSDLADEKFGEDARDTEDDLPWDLYCGPEFGDRYNDKLKKAVDNRVAVLRVPVEIIDDLLLKSHRADAMQLLNDLYEKARDEAKRRNLRSRVELTKLETRWYQAVA